MMTDNVVLPFQIEGQSFRGRLVRLGSELDAILKRHAYPDSVTDILGRAVSIASAMGTAFKFDGVFTLQARGEGAVPLVVADVTTSGLIRGYAQIKEGVDLDDQSSLMGSGYVAFTADQTLNKERYQGVVEREGDDLTKAVQHYFRQSEQIPTALMAAVHQGDDGCWRGGCLFLQRLASEGGVDPLPQDTSKEDDWTQAMMLMGTCTEAELTDPNLPPEDLLFRLFNEQGVRVFDKIDLKHECRCSAARVQSVLISLPSDELKHLEDEKGLVTVTCEFCNRSYGFTEAQINALKDE